jgi:Cft2 family RNA processing exonuclease
LCWSQEAFEAEHRNPFLFSRIKHLSSASHFDDIGACVVMATPSMLQSGVSRELLEAWCEDKRCVPWIKTRPPLFYRSHVQKLVSPSALSVTMNSI